MNTPAGLQSEKNSEHDVFVSYASQDAGVANSIVENLEQHGLKCWIAPRDVTPGSQYADEIVAAINDSKVFVLVLSEHAVGSAHVGRELERAASKRRRIIVLRTDAAPLTRSFEYFLSESQWIDVAALGVPAALTKLTQAVGQRLAPSSWVSPGLGTDVRDPADRNRKPSYLTIKRAIAAAVFVVVAAIVVSVLVGYWPLKPQAPVAATILDKSIAVLPFVDMSEKKDQEYFGDGMAEEIIDLMVKIPGLRVIGRTSSFAFKGKTEDLRSIAKQLGVAYVLEGSVRKSGDRMRVTAQLIDSGNGTPRWSQTYDRDFTEVLKLQDEIATRVVREVENDAFFSEFVSRKTLRNSEAYTAFLQGIDAIDRANQQSGEQALSDFQRALDLDPSFAEAATGLANTYRFLGNFGFMPPAVAFEKARNAAELALKLDPNQSAAHRVLSYIHIVHDWDWPAAEREIQLAKALSPQGEARTGDSLELSMTLGRWDDALRIANAAVTADPLDPTSYFWLGILELRRGRLAEAEAAMRRTSELSPSYTYLHYNLALVQLARSEPEAALTESLKEPSEPARLLGSALAYFTLGRKAESDAAFAQALKSYGPYIPSGVAAAYAFRGESDEAFKWLERAYMQRDTFLNGIKYRTEFDKLHDDPRYKAFLRKMNLPEG